MQLDKYWRVIKGAGGLLVISYVLVGSLRHNLEDGHKVFVPGLDNKPEVSGSHFPGPLKLRIPMHEKERRLLEGDEPAAGPEIFSPRQYLVLGDLPLSAHIGQLVGKRSDRHKVDGRVFGAHLDGQRFGCEPPPAINIKRRWGGGSRPRMPPKNRTPTHTKGGVGLDGKEGDFVGKRYYQLVGEEPRRDPERVALPARPPPASGYDPPPAPIGQPRIHTRLSRSPPGAQGARPWRRTPRRRYSPTPDSSSVVNGRRDKA
jgi:hypothetical protein